MISLIGTIATIISTIVAIISAVATVKSRNEAQKILNELKITVNKHVVNSENNCIKNTGTNDGVMSLINTGEINNVKRS